MKAWQKSALGIAAFAGVSALLAWAYLEGRNERARELERESPVKAASRVSHQNGRSVLTLNEATQRTCGMGVTPLEAAAPGVLVPSSAVVWWENGAWVYVQTDGENFERRGISAAKPVQGGWLVEQGMAPGDRVVARGAQMLLSEELRAEIQVGEEGEHK